MCSFGRRVFRCYSIVKTRRLDGTSWQLMLDKIDAVFLVSPTDLVLEAEELSKTLLEAMPTYGSNNWQVQDHKIDKCKLWSRSTSQEWQQRAQCRLQPQRRETNTTSKLEVGANANEKGVNSQDLTTGKDIPLQGLHCCHPQGTCKVLKKRRKERECFRSRIKV